MRLLLAKNLLVFLLVFFRDTTPHELAEIGLDKISFESI